MSFAENGRIRVAIENVNPEIDAGRFPIKRVVGETVQVEADVFADGHDLLSCVLLYRFEDEMDWRQAQMVPGWNDRWRGSFAVSRLGRYRYTVQAWTDPFRTWQRDMEKRIKAGQNVAVDLIIGAELIEETAGRAGGDDAARLLAAAGALRTGTEETSRLAVALNQEVAELMRRFPDKTHAATYERELQVVVDREKARFSTWYELFPRSTSPTPGEHGTFQDCEKRLPYIAEMGFDVVYLPPIHPIGKTHRKGKNNAVKAEPNDVGSPWGIGAAEGGHKCIHPQLGTMQDFHRFLAAAKEFGMEVALDLAYQCSPDHPYIKAHRSWFRERPDGSIQYAENPPKKYQDIFPIDFETEDWRALWAELKSVVDFWIEQGVRIFRVDNPHTKSFPFWEWLITGVKKKHPDVIFLSEAFTRPRVMYRLAKLGFTQSYTYFAWRNAKWELTEYFLDLTETEIGEYFRPNLWPNTPDILTEYLQHGGRPAFMIRLVLAATLGASYGIYGPAFELCVKQPREPESEEYLNSEKYEIKDWDLNHPDSLKDFIARVNHVRKENPALQSDRRLRFHEVDNPQLICYSKSTEDLSNIILVVVNLDPYHTHSGWIALPLEDFQFDSSQPYQAHDLLCDAHYLWQGDRNYVELNPHVVPAHIFVLRKKVRTERDFDYYL